MGLRNRFAQRCSSLEHEPETEEDFETHEPRPSEISKVTAILLFIGLVCLPFSFTVQSYLSVSNTVLLFIFSLYIIPVYMMAAANLLILVIGDERGHLKFRACSA